MPLVGSARRLSCGVEAQKDSAHARVWAPACRRVDVVLERGGQQSVVPLEQEAGGYFSGQMKAAPGDRYWFRLDGDRLRPDPASRSQPDGPHEPSAYVDPAAFRWANPWRGLRPVGQVIYEMHIGTFTLYGTPDDLRRFIDSAHASGIGVILDVVYNHLGPDGNYLTEFSEDYFTDKYTNDWGRAVNFEGPAAARALFVQNARYWIEEFHFDGLRLDATQDVKDASPRHVLAEITAASREAAGEVPIYLVAENEPQHTVIV